MQDGKHVGVNNTTGRCPACGEYIDLSPWKDKAKEQKCLFDDFNPANGPLCLSCSCPKCSPR